MTSDVPRKPRAFVVDELREAEPDPAVKDGPSKKTSQTRTKSKSRKPKAVMDEAVLRTVPDSAAQRDGLPENDPSALAESLTPPPLVVKRRFKWSRIFWIALTGLVSLGIGLWVDELVRSLFQRNEWLGWAAAVLTGLLVLAALAIATREIVGLMRMAKIDHLRDRAVKAHEQDAVKEARQVVDDLVDLYSSRPDTAKGRAALSLHEGEIIDGRDLLALAERDLLAPLDRRAQGLVMGSAKRVSVVTAVSPRAIVDLAFVAMENLRLIRRMADLYGGRPGTLGFLRLARNVIAHLAVTGSIAIGDGLIQQVVGHGVAARISSRLGEGVVNGLLTARIGIAAIDVCRPLPFTAQTRPTVRDFMGELLATTAEPDVRKEA